MIAYSVAYFIGWSFGFCHLDMKTMDPLIHRGLAQELDWAELDWNDAVALMIPLYPSFLDQVSQ
jgi:hypothetical protein